MNRKKLIYIILFAVSAVIIVLLLINRDEKPEEKANEKKMRHVSFLHVAPEWADSVLAKMNLQDKIAQLFIVEVNKNFLTDSAFSAEIPTPGGFVFTGLPANEMISVHKKLKEKEKIPLLLSVDDNSYFYNEKHVSSDSALIAFISDDSLVSEFSTITAGFGKQTGLNFLQEPVMSSLRKDSSVFADGFNFSNKKLAKNATLFSQLCAGKNVLSSAFVPFELKDTLKNKNSTLYLQTLTDSGVAVLEIDSRWTESDQQKINAGYHLTSQLHFKGIILGSLNEKKNIRKQLIQLFENGVGLIRVTKYIESLNALTELVNENEVEKAMIDEKVKKILLAKSWIEKKKFKEISSRPVHPRQDVMEKLLKEAAVCVLKNENKLLPLKRINSQKTLFASVGSPVYDRIISGSFLNTGMEIKTANFKNLSSLLSNKNATGSSLLIVAVDKMKLSDSDKKSIDELKKLQSSKNIVVINYSNAENLKYLDGFKHLIYSPSDDPEGHIAVIQQLLGNIRTSGKLPGAIASFKAGTGVTTKKTRLSFTTPEELGFNRDSLLTIDYIMEEGIRNSAFPGGVVLLAKDGKIFYHKAFGHHTYSREKETKKDNLFDIASMTKICATTVMAMHLYEKKKYGLDDSLKKHLPDTLKEHFIYNSTLENITFRELLVHGSGLPAGHNIIRYLRFDEDFGKYDLYFCDEGNEDYCVPVAENFYLEKCCVDTLWYDLNRLGTDGTKDYRYSDANMNVLYTFLRAKIDNKWDRYLDSLFYSPLGMKRTCFNPLEKEFEKDEIVPTENDKYWREQLLQGYVHDPTAALYGGVAGNAGLFSTAYDLAILAQLWLNKGEYGGERYFNSATVDLFTSSQPGTHRGLGFNKQISGSTYGCSPYASDKTYGHTGFTGTAIWIDPETNIIYIFLTNRVHPESDNKKIIELGTTKRVHNVVYELMMNAMEKQNELEF